MADDRDALKSKTPPARVSAQIAKPFSAVPRPGSADAEDYTGQHHAIPEADRDPNWIKGKRRTRSDSERIEHLEGRADKTDELLGQLNADVGELKPELALITGRLEVLPDFMADVREAIRVSREKDRVLFTAQVDVETAKAKAQITEDVEQHKADIKNDLDAKKTRRRIWTRVIIAVGAAGMGGAGALVHYLLAHL